MVVLLFLDWISSIWILPTLLIGSKVISNWSWLLERIIEPFSTAISRSFFTLGLESTCHFFSSDSLILNLPSFCSSFSFPLKVIIVSKVSGFSSSNFIQLFPWKTFPFSLSQRMESMAFSHECFDSLSDWSISLWTLQELNLTKSDALNPGIKSDKNVIKTESGPNLWYGLQRRTEGRV